MSEVDKMNGAGQNQPAQLRLKPDMASLRLLVLAFVRDYIGKWSASPSYGEIAAALDTNRTRIRKAVKSLAADGLLLRTPGPRGLALPESREDALRVLRTLGWQVDETAAAAHPPHLTGPVTNPPLLPPPELDYLPLATGGENDGQQGGRNAGVRENIQAEGAG